MNLIFLYSLAFKANEYFDISKKNNFNYTLLLQKKDTLLNHYLKIKKLYEDNKLSESLEKGLNLIDLAKEKNNIEVIVLSNYLIGDVFEKTKNHNRALKYYKNVIGLISKEKFKKNEFTSLKNELFDKETILVETYLKLASLFQKLNKLDSTKHYYNKIDKVLFTNKRIEAVKAKTYNNLSVIAINESKFELAKEYGFKAVEIHKKQNNRTSQAAVLSNLGSIYLYEENYLKAKELYSNGLELIERINGVNEIKIREDLYYNMAYAMYKLKDYKAYDYQELSYEIKDSLRDKEVRGMIEKLDAKYNFNSAKKLLLKEEENKRLKDQRTFWIYGIGSFIVILSLLYGLNFYKLKQKNLGLKLSQTRLIQNQNLEKIKSESQTRILNATIDGKEEERKQIAETLHDSVSALLSSANLHLQATKSQFNGETPIEIDKTREIIIEASQKIRDLSHTLVSSVLLKFGLNYALKDMADKYSNSQILISTDIQDVRRYQQSFEIKVHNIIQEFVNNILKHSEAKNANIFLRESNNILLIKISDDGIGFDKNSITKKDGLGINQIDARIQVMEGKFNINSSKGNGTEIKVELPVLEKEITSLV